MPRIATQNIKAGMVLAEPATDLLGNALLTAGRRIREDDIRTLKSWGVTHVEVEPDASSPSGGGSGRRRRTSRVFRRRETATREMSAGQQAPPKRFPERLAALNHMFEPHEGDPLMDNLRRIVETQLRRRAEKE